MKPLASLPSLVAQFSKNVNNRKDENWYICPFHNGKQDKHKEFEFSTMEPMQSSEQI